MSFAIAVPAQSLALSYLCKMGARYPGLSLVLGGHSKGGNLAVYAFCKAPQDIQDRVRAVFNNDGPGFNEDMEASVLESRLESRIHTFVPQSSIIGMLMTHPENYTIVKSSEIFIMQHEPYSWLLAGPAFDTAKDRDWSSYYFDRVIHDALASVSRSERESFVDTLFAMLSACNVETVRDLRHVILKKHKEIGKAWEGIDGDEKKMAAMAVKALIQAMGGKPLESLIVKASGKNNSKKEAKESSSKRKIMP